MQVAAVNDPTVNPNRREEEIEVLQEVRDTFGFRSRFAFRSGGFVWFVWFGLSTFEVGHVGSRSSSPSSRQVANNNQALTWSIWTSSCRLNPFIVLFLHEWSLCGGRKTRSPSEEAFNMI